MRKPALALIGVLLPGVALAGFDPARSPFADKPADSYSNYTDASGKPGVLIWGQAPFEDFGERKVAFDESGVRQLRPAPAPGVHPRIYFGPEDLPDVRRRLRETRCGQEAWKNLLCWTQMMKGEYDDTQDYARPDRFNGGFGGLHSRVPLFRIGVPREGNATYDHSPRAAAFYKGLIDGDATGVPGFYWNTLALEAFRCLIEQDETGARNAARATVTLMKAGQAARAANPKQTGKPPEQPVGGFQLAYVYDFINTWLTPDQRQAMHDELAAGSWSHDNYGTFNTAETSRSNWATFSYWLYEVLAIEGEPGFNDLKVRGMYRGWRNLLTYGWFQSGATFEGEAKNQLGMDGIIPFAMRRQEYGFEDLCGHPYLRAYADRFLPHSLNSMLTGFHKYDLLGGSRAKGGGFTPCDMMGLKYMFPQDQTIDWVYRKTIGEDYANLPDRPDGYFNGLLFTAIFASDFDPANNDPERLGLGHTFFCPERALLMTRSGWDTDADMLNLHTRAANGGHPFADRNAIMVAGAGRVWSPNGYASFKTAENSVVCIDGQSQAPGTPGRMVDFQDRPEATFAVGDASYGWDWKLQQLHENKGYYTIDDAKSGRIAVPEGTEPEKHSANDFSYLKLPFGYLNQPAFEAGNWIKPKGALQPTVRAPFFPVQRAFRTAGLVRGAKPYMLVIDDIQKDAQPHHYDWTLALEPDIQIAQIDQKNDREMDIVLTGSDPDQTHPKAKDPLPSALAPGTAIPERQPMLLVRVLNRGADPGKPAAEPQIVELPNTAAKLANGTYKYGPVRRLLIPSDAADPQFKVLLYPYRQGGSLPLTTWDAARTAVTVDTGAGKDTVAFGAGSLGKTDVKITRGGQEIVSMQQAIAPLP